ncbi:hypothetical protein NDI45_28010 [Leptolyngbya sp. GB1-A1]|uniref:hypothetical protein n=1 Tax=Leptolyngbya sp. GB1-A1 TaxID=2933908 RepID=UPI003299686B
MNAIQLTEQQQEKKELLAQISEKHLEWKEKRQLNSRWDGSLTITTIVLTLFTAILGTDGISINENAKNALIAILSGSVIAIQSVGNAFPVKQRAGGYRAIESQAWSLKSRVGFLQADAEISENLPKIQEQFYELVSKSAELEI